MSRAGASLLALAGVATGLALAAGVLHARDTTYQVSPSTERLLYLRSGRAADRLMLSFDAVAADVYWIRAIQHYGRDAKSTRTADRFTLLQPLLDLTTTLDPYFNIAYRFGAVFLAFDPPDGPGRPDQAIALLEKGLKHNPDRWQYAMDVGYIHYWYTRDVMQASRWFGRAAAMPHAPEWLRPLPAMMLVQGGDRMAARWMLKELANSEEAYLRRAAERSIAYINALDGMDTLEGLIEEYHTSHHVYPTGWSDLVRARMLTGVPLDHGKTGVPFVYDSVSHRVTLSPDSSLYALARNFPRR